MVEIVGVDPAQKHRITCENCASILEYTKNEVREYGQEWVDCPKCEKKVIIRPW
jgi:RNase P subunit RPR2